MTLCLAMIVKNESHLIKKTLQNIYDHVPLHYWIISDTGSTDKTKEIIQDFFDEKCIPGELISRKWVNFGHNRTELLDYAFQRTDYLFLFDADDTIHGQLQLPNVMTADAYLCKFATSSGTYTRPCIVTNRKKWFYTGVLHEYLDTTEERHGELLDGDYFFESGRTGSRNKVQDKYLKDALLLEKEIQGESNAVLRVRYMYFCAQSYLDHGDVGKAIEWYRKFLNEPNGKMDDRYMACISLASLYQKKNDFLNASLFLCNSAMVDPSRIEGIVMLMIDFFKNENHMMVNLLYHRYKNYLKVKQLNKDYYQEQLYDYVMESFNSISAPHVGDVESGYDCCKKVILNSKNKNNVMACVENLTRMYKKQYDKDPVFKATVEKRFTNG
jgi:glycosyltransferase involved in cell wall biosynthesis